MADENRLEIDEEQPQVAPSRRIDQSIAENPVVPSAPSDAEAAPATVDPKADYVNSATAIDPRYWSTPGGSRALNRAVPPAAVAAAQNEQRQQNYAGALDRFDARRMLEAQKETGTELNRVNRSILGSSRVETATDEEGNVVPRTDATGQVQFRPGKGPITYDGQGKAVQTQWDAAGPNEVALDAKAPIGPHPETPNDLYRQNKHGPWDYLGTVQDGLTSADEATKSAAEKAQLGLDKRLHGDVATDLGLSVNEAANNLRSRAVEVQGKAQTLKQLNGQLEQLNADPRLGETEGGFLGMGSHPTQTAQELTGKKAALEQQISDLQSQTSLDPKQQSALLKPEKDALAAAHSMRRAWTTAAPKELGDLDRLIQNRTDAVGETGGDPSADPVLSALEKRKAALGILSKKAEVGIKNPEEEKLRADPTFGPLLQERDAISADAQKSKTDLDSLGQQYETQLAPLRAQVQKAQAQLQPLNQQVDAFTAKLEQLVGLPPAMEGEDLDVRRDEVSNRIAQLTDPVQKARVQRVLDALEPASANLQAATARAQPIFDQHDQLQATAQQDLQAKSEAANSNISQRAVALQDKLTSVSNDREQQNWNAILAHQAVLDAKTADPSVKGYNVSPDNKLQFVPGHEATGMAQAVKDGLMPKEAFDEQKKDARLRDMQFAQDAADRRPPPGTSERLKNFVGSIGASFQRGVGELVQFGASHLISEEDKRSMIDAQSTSDDDLERRSANWILNAQQAVKDYGDTVAKFGEENFVDPKLASDWEAHVGRFIGGATLPVATAMAGGPAALFPMLYAQGYQGVMNDADAKSTAGQPINRGAVEKSAVEAGALNAALGVVFEGFGRGVTSLSKPVYTEGQQAIRDAIVRAYEKNGLPGVQAVNEIVQQASKAAGKPISAEAAQAMLGAFEEVQKDIGTTLSQRIMRVFGTMARDAALGGGTQLGQNAVASQYDPSRGLLEGVGEAAAGFGAIGAIGGTAREVGKARSAARDAQFAPERTQIGEAPQRSEAATAPLSQDAADKSVATAANVSSAHSEIESLPAKPDLVAPEQVDATQTALRGLVKIGTGQPLAALTTAERQALLAKHEGDGLPRLEMVKGPDGKAQPVITQGALDRIEKIAPTVRSLLPESEEKQRQAILSGRPATQQSTPADQLSHQEQSQASSPSTEPALTAKGSQGSNVLHGTFSVEVERPGGKIETMQVSAPDAKAAHAQVAGSIKPGQGMVRDVVQTSEPAPQGESGKAKVENFGDQAVQHIAHEAGRALSPAEEKTVRKLTSRLAPAVQRWQAAFSGMRVSARTYGSMGGAVDADSKLHLSLPDIVLHAHELASKEAPDVLVRHEAIHAVTQELTRQGKIDPVAMYRALPEEVKRYVEGVYKPTANAKRDEHEDAHEFVRLLVEHRLRLEERGLSDEAGHVITEDLSPGFMAKIRAMLVKLLSVFRDLAGQLKKHGASAETIGEVEKTRDLVVARIKEVDAEGTGIVRRKVESERGLAKKSNEQTGTTRSAAAGRAGDAAVERAGSGGDTDTAAAADRAGSVAGDAGKLRAAGENDSGKAGTADAKAELGSKKDEGKIPESDVSPTENRPGEIRRADGSGVENGESGSATTGLAGKTETAADAAKRSVAEADEISNARRALKTLGVRTPKVRLQEAVVAARGANIPVTSGQLVRFVLSGKFEENEKVESPKSKVAEAEKEQKLRTFSTRPPFDQFGSELTPVSSSIINDLGGLMSKSTAQRKGVYEKNKDLWEGAPQLAHPTHSKIYASEHVATLAEDGSPTGKTKTVGKGGQLPDAAAQELYDAGLIREPTPDAMWSAIGKESKTARTAASSEQREKQTEQFLKAASTHGAGTEQVPVKDLAVGDSVKVGTETMKVIGLDPDTFEVTLQDGRKFGIQKVQDDEVIYGEHLSVSPKDEVGIKKEENAAPQSIQRGTAAAGISAGENAGGKEGGDQPGDAGAQPVAAETGAKVETGGKNRSYEPTQDEIREYKSAIRAEYDRIENPTKKQAQDYSARLTMAAGTLRNEKRYPERFAQRGKEAAETGATAKGSQSEQLVPAQTFDQFSVSRGVQATAPSFPEAHRSEAKVSEPSKKAMMQRIAQAGAEWSAQREALRAEYESALQAGTIRQPTRIERLQEIAKGEGTAAEAARRVLEKHSALQAQATRAPKLPSGEKGTGDLFQGEDQPFNLLGETGIDHGARQKAGEKNALEASAAKDLQDKQQSSFQLQAQDLNAEPEPKTPSERFNKTMPLAISLARSYANIPGVELADVQQHALKALVRAAQEYDSTKGSMATFARTVVGNELKTLYGKQKSKAREMTTLEAEPGENAEGVAATETAKDKVAASDNTLLEVQRAEGIRVLNESINELPGRMKDALLAVLGGEGSLEDIGQKLGGISRQAVQRLTVEGMRRLRGKLGEKGITSTDDLLAAQSLAEKQRAVLRTDEHGKDIVWEQGPFSIAVDDPNDARYITLWKEGVRGKIGSLSLTPGREHDTRGYASVASVEIFPQFRGRGLGKQLYKVAKQFLGEQFNGIASEQPDRANKKQVPKIWRSLGATHTDSGAWLLTQKLLDAIDNTLKAQATDDPVERLMTMLQDDPLEILRGLAADEESKKAEGGIKKTIGRPDLALGNLGPEMRAVHEAHTDSATPQTIDGWDKEAAELLRSSPDFGAQILKRWGDGLPLTPPEVRAAQRWIIDRQGTPKSGLEQERYDAAAYAYTKIGEATARSLAARRDPLQTPVERARDFLAKAKVQLTKKQDGEIAALTDQQAKMKAIEQAVNARRGKIDGALAAIYGKGVTLDDILTGETELRLRGAAMVQNIASGFAAKEQQALKLVQGGELSFEAIAKKTGLSKAEVESVRDRFVDEFRAKHFAKFEAGLKAEQMDAGGVLFAQPTDPVKAQGAHGAGAISDAEAEFARALKMMGIVPKADQGVMKVVKRRVKKPAASTRQVSGAGVATAPASGDLPYPYDVTATGRVLGQPGLPLYQEMMVRRGLDLGSTDDVAKLGRIISAAANGNRFDMLYEAWMASILSGPTTHFSYKLALAANMGLEFTVQRGVEALVNLAYGDAKSAQFGEFKALMQGLLPGVTRGLGLAMRQFDSEAELLREDVLNTQAEMFPQSGPGRSYPPAISETPVSQFLDVGQRTAVARGISGAGKAIDRSLGALGKYNPVRGRVIRIPMRVLYFVQGFYSGLSGQLAAGAHAYRIAKAEGLESEKMSARINELVSSPNSAAWQRAVEEADMLTFQQPVRTSEKGGNVLENAVAQFIKARSGSHLIGSQFPFIQLPFNLVRTGLRKTPLGSMAFLWRLLKSGFFKLKDGKPVFESYPAAEQVRHLAEQLIGWTTAAVLWNSIWGDDDDGKKLLSITGSMPRSDVKKGERELYERTYGGPYQIIVGGRNGTHINYGKYEPVATVLGSTADVIHQLKSLKRGEQNAAQTLGGIWSYLVSQVEEKTFLRGMRDLHDAIGKPGEIGKLAEKQLMQALVPNLIRQPLRNLDQYVRDWRTASARYYATGEASQAEPKIDLYGRKEEKQGNSFSRMFFQAGVKPDGQLQKADQMFLNYTRHHPNAPAEFAPPTTPQASYKDASGRDVPMSARQQTEFYEKAGKKAAQMLGATNLSVMQIEHPKEEDVKAVKEIFEQAHAQIKREMFSRAKVEAMPKRTTNVVREWLGKAA